MATRQLMGEIQLKATTDNDEKLEQQIKQRMLEKERKYQLQDQQKEEKKKKAHEELTHFFKKHVS